MANTFTGFSNDEILASVGIRRQDVPAQVNITNKGGAATPSPAPAVSEDKDEDKGNFWDRAKGMFGNIFTKEEDTEQPTTLQTTNKPESKDDEDVSKYVEDLSGKTTAATYDSREGVDDVDYGKLLVGVGRKGINQFAGTIASTADWLLGKPLAAAGWENNPFSWLNQEMKNEAQMLSEIYDENANQSVPAQLFNKYGPSVVATLPDALTAIYSGGASAALSGASKSGGIINTVRNAMTTLIKNPQFWTSFARTAGPSYEEAVSEGASDIEASAAAVLTALNSGIIEVGGGGIQELPNEVRNNGTPGILAWVKSTLDEGKEEVVQGIMTRAVQNLVYRGGPVVSLEDENAVFNPKTMAEDAAGGLIVGGLVSGGQLAVNAAINAGRANTQTPTTPTTPNAPTPPTAPTAPIEAPTAPITPPEAPTVPTPAQGEISPSEGVSAEPTTYTANAENVSRVDPGAPGFEATNVDGERRAESAPPAADTNINTPAVEDTKVNTPFADDAEMGIFSDTSVGAAAPAQGKTVPTRFSLKDSEWGTQEMRDAIDPGTHEEVGRALRHARARGRLITDENGNMLYVEETADDLLDVESWDRIDQTLATSYLAPELFNRGDMDRYQKLMERVVKNRSEAGGMLQEARDYPRTPDGKVAQAIQAVQAINDTKNSKADRNRTNVGGTTKAAKSIVEGEVEAAAEAAEAGIVKETATSTRKKPSSSELNPDGSFKVGTKVMAKDRGNIGTVVSYDPATNTYLVRFVAKNGATKTVRLPADQLEALRGPDGKGGKSRANDSEDKVSTSYADIGERLANKLIKQAENNFSTPSEEQQILNILTRFANEHGAPKGERRKSETAVDQLKHYLANKDAYHKAWQRMQALINEKGWAEANPELLSAFNNILTTSGADIHGMSEGTIIRAMLEGSKDLGISKTDIQKYAALDAESAVAQKLSENLISEVGASGTDAIGIELAVKDYVAKIAAEDTAEDRLGGVMSAAAKATDIKLGDVLKQSWQDKAKARKAIADYVVEKYGLVGDEAIAAADAISQRFYNELAERSQRALEARFKPRGRRKSKTRYERFAELLINMDAVNDDTFRDLAVQSIYGEDVQLSEAEIREIHLIMEESIAARATDPRKADLLEAQANKIIASKMPRSFKNKLTTMLYNSMLGNLKTLIARNALGNVGLAALEQAPTKVFTAAADKIIGGVTGERYHAMPNLEYYKEYGKGFAKGIKDFASDFAVDVHTPRSGEEATVEMQYKPFKSEFMNGINKLVRGGLEIGDRPFYEAQYAARMQELNRLKDGRKLSEEQIAEFDEWAPVMAQLDALSAVFQTKNTKDNPEAAKTAEGLRNLKEAVNGIVQGVTGMDIAGQAALPFTSTPGNILETFADYAPGLGLAKNAIQSGREIREGRFNQSRAAKQLGRQATGALLWGAGQALAGMGAVSGGGNEQDKELLEQSGWQDYSVKIGNHWYGFEWLPIIGPLLAGAADFHEARKYGDANFLDALGTAAGTVTEMSALQGLNRLFGGYGNTVEGFADALLGLPGQAVPSIMRQFAKTADEYERTTYDPNAIVSELKYVASGIPFVRNLLPEAVDMFGNPVEAGDGRGYGARALENFLSPGWLSEEKDDPLTNELLRLAESGNAVGISTIDKTYTDSTGRTVKMSAAQYHDYQVTRGTVMAEIMEGVMSSASYNSLTDAQKSEAMEFAVDVANDAAKAELFKNAGLKYNSEYADVVALGDDAGDYVLTKEAFAEVHNAYSNEEAIDPAAARALDALLGKSGSYGRDVMELLEEVKGFKALAAANEAGLSTQTYFSIKDATRDYSKAWQKNEAILDMRNLSEQDKLTAIKLNFDSANTQEKWQTAYDSGIPLNIIVAYYSSEQLVGADGKKLPAEQRRNAALQNMTAGQYDTLKGIWK